jgi:diguanylate cyclase (GGDEF)-like protein
MKILIAEDDLILRTLIEELLGRWDHQVIVCEDGGEAMAQVEAKAPFDVAILDWMMPGAAGVEVCARIREVYKERRPYVLMLTAKSQIEDVVNGLDAGADDYLTKPYRAPEFAARLRAAERLLKMQDDLIAAKRLVAYQAEHDVHTDTLNRAAFLARMHALFIERQRSPRPASLVRADLAGFGRFNEEHGPDTGDEVLRGVAQRLRAALPPGAILGRTGGDEFLVLLPDADEPRAEDVARELHVAVREAPYETQKGELWVRADVVTVTASAAAELDVGWMLCAVEALAASGGAPPSLGRANARPAVA